MNPETSGAIHIVPIRSVNVLNPRVRSPKIFNEIVESIAAVGLKRPITVAHSQAPAEVQYELVCGQGRLEACIALGYHEIPAFVVDADEEDRLVASLVENCARRQPTALDLLQDIHRMKKQGYTNANIARKTGLSADYVGDIATLLEKGEERLIGAVEAGVMPIRIAIEIASATDQDVQAALQSAYESNALRGRKLIAARRILETRRRHGKSLRSGPQAPAIMPTSVSLVKAFEEDAERKRNLIRRSEIAHARLTFILEAIRRLLEDEAFFSLLEEEDLATLPGNLALRLPEVRELSQ